MTEKQEKMTSGEESDETKSHNDCFAQYYGMLSHQQNMMQDLVRTSTYEKAILTNAADFEGKVVLDVGTGSGILAFFAAKAGAKKVYGVEASAMAICARKLVEANGLSDKIEILHGKLEDIEPPEKVDVIISEPLGFLLVHERMLEIFVQAREKWLKPGGLMMPSVGTIYIAPFCDQAIYDEQMSKAMFWNNSNFYGVDLTCLVDEAKSNHMGQAVVGYFPKDILLSPDRATYVVDFNTATVESLSDFHIPLNFKVDRTSLLHGLACWFDVDFNGTENHVKLCTGPGSPDTHWYQCQLLFKEPLAVNATQNITGNMHFVVNESSSYEIKIELKLEGTDIEVVNMIHLHDQHYHYLTPNAYDSNQQQWQQYWAANPPQPGAQAQAQAPQ
jgi:histone-arginine methyltransferase CARM1